MRKAPGITAHSEHIGGYHEVAKADNFRTDIEGMRGLAILLVVLFHAKVPGVAGGFVGVDIFFVLSGYLITGLLITEWDDKGHIALLRFFARRVARLLPAVTLTILATVVAARMLLSPVELLRVTRSAVLASIYLSNVSFAHNLDYFEGLADEDLLLHTWSLAVEEQYYLVWPVLILISAYCVGKLDSRSRRLWSIVVVVVVSFAWCQWQMHTMPVRAFFLMPGRAWEFAVGGFVRIMPMGILYLSRRLTLILGCAGLLLIVSSAIGLSESIPYPGLAVLLPVMGTASVLAAGSVTPTAGALRVLGTSLMRWLGKVSYSWYLWHWPVLAITLLVFTTYSVAARLVICAVSLALANLCYRFVEAPLRRLGQAMPRHGVVVALGLTLSIGCALISHLMERYAETEARKPRFVELESLRKDRSEAARDCMLRYTVSQPHPCQLGNATALRQVWASGRLESRSVGTSP